MQPGEVTALIAWLERRKLTLGKPAARAAEKLLPELHALRDRAMANPSDKPPKRGTKLAKLYDLWQRSPRKYS